MSQIRRRVTLFLVTLLSSSTVALAADPPPSASPSTPARASAPSLPASTAATIGTPLSLGAPARDAAATSGAHAGLRWSSADPSIATVDAAGQVTPLRAGFTRITASTDGASATTLLSVRGTTPIPTRSRYVGTNLAGLAYWTKQFPFADLMKNSTGWEPREDSGARDTTFAALTADGYPASLRPGQHAVAAVAWDGVRYAPGRYVVLWDGEGSVSVPSGHAKKVASSANRLAVEVTDTKQSMRVSIDKTNPANPVRNLRFLWPGTEATHATQPFNPVFLERTAPFSVLRFMDWGSTNGSTVANWGDRAQLSDVTYAKKGGVPIEMMIALANTLQADPWFCIPHQANDDYVRRFATLLRDTLDPGLRPHIEYSNEVWNSGFAQTKWALAQAQKLGLPRPSGLASAFYAQRSVEIFRIVQEVYGADRSRLVRVIAGQAAWTQFQDSALAWKDTAANADVLAIAPYFKAASANDVARVEATLALSPSAVLDQMRAEIAGPVRSWIVANAKLAKKHGLTLKAYEAGPHDVSFHFPADKQDAMTELFGAAHRDPGMRDVYAEYLNVWLDGGGDTLLQYNDIGGWSKWGLWSALEYTMQDPAAAPKYRALLDFIAAHPAAR